jgi:predicted RNase H-like nuclease (RuvC/YqgF family)
MKYDRNYLRMMHDCELTHYAKEHGTTELEFVLLERLCTLIDVDEQLERAQVTIEDLHNDMAALKAEIAELQEELDAMEAEADHDTHTN